MFVIYCKVEKQFIDIHVLKKKQFIKRLYISKFILSM